MRILRVRLDSSIVWQAFDDERPKHELPNTFEISIRLATSAGPLTESARVSLGRKGKWTISTVELNEEAIADLARSRQRRILVLTVATAVIAKSVLRKIRQDVLSATVRVDERQSRDNDLCGDDGEYSIIIPTPAEALHMRRLMEKLAPVQTTFTIGAAS